MLRSVKTRLAVVLVVACVSASLTATAAATPAVVRGSGFSPATRVASQQLYDDLYLAENDALVNWTGSVAGCANGETGDLFKNGVANRINYFRAMAGVPDDIVLDPTLNAKAQGAALLMAANQDLDHDPPADWACWTQARHDAAGSSNLHLGSVGAAAITSYMQDAGASNGAVGHRRWILHPQTQQMGTGDVKTPSWQSTTNALWVFDGHTFDPLPDLRDGYVAWPPPGFVPTPVVFPRWSLSLDGANFAGAHVTMTRNGAAVTVNQLAGQGGYGLNTLVWEPQVSLATAATFHVSVTGITGTGSPGTVSYDVRSFVPDETPPTVTIRTPSATPVYRQGTTALADYDCSDGPDGSGVASCVGTVADGQPLDTSTLGAHPFSVTATDNVGRQTIDNRPYTVTTRPDATVAVGATGTVVGDGVYSSTVTATQTVSATVARGATRTFVARLGNDAGAPATFTLRAASSGSSGFQVRVVRDGVDITTEVLAGTFQLTDLAAGATATVKVKVTATTASARGAARNVDLVLSSTAGPVTKDKVRARAVRS